ncbi:MAG: hypothetical protein EBQ92_04110 [Proteobacteria bacterium]|nr:hypothetical protein [Pseudomonadota bacterium]
MSERVQNFEFRDDYRNSQYPFSDNASRISNEYRRVIAPGTFIDALLYPIGAISNVYLSQIDITAKFATFSLADVRRRALAVAVVDLLNAPDLIYFYDSYSRPAGTIVTSPLSLSQFSAWELGTHTFNLKQTEFVASCIKIPVNNGVQGFSTETGELFAGDVYLLGENGITLTVADDVITVNAVGDPLYRRIECLPTAKFIPPSFFLTINGCPPDQYGNFNITVGDNITEDTIIRVVQTDGGLEIRAIGT